MQSETGWREKFRLGTFGAFKVFSPTTTCRLCVGKLDFSIEVFPETLGSVGEKIEKFDVLRSLIFLWGYNFDLLQMVRNRFLHDCHLGNILMLSGRFVHIWSGFAWHDFGSHSYHASPEEKDLQWFEQNYAGAMSRALRRIGHFHLDLEARLTSATPKLVTINVYSVEASLYKAVRQVQEAIMQWRHADAAHIQMIQNTMLEMWRWTGESEPRIRELEELAEGQGFQSANCHGLLCTCPKMSKYYCSFHLTPADMPTNVYKTLSPPLHCHFTADQS